VVYVNASNQIEELSIPAANGSIWTSHNFSDLTGSSTKVAVPYVRGDGVASMIYINSDSHIRVAELNGGTWGTRDLSALSGAPDALNPNGGVGSVPNGYMRSDNITTIVYQTAARHIIEIGLMGTTTAFSDLTSYTGGTL
jgi:hypothetical protein